MKKFPTYEGVAVIADSTVSDIRRRTWRERLLTWPWRPFKKYVEAPVAYHIGENTVIVSWKTFNRVMDKNTPFDLANCAILSMGHTKAKNYQVEDFLNEAIDGTIAP